MVFKVDAAGNETVIYAFLGEANGSSPQGSLVQDPEGNLYGTTEYGGTGCTGIGCGVVYKVDAAGAETVLYSFKGGTDATNPQSGLTRDAAGNLYGTTQFGGTGGGWGTVYEVNTSGQETLLYSFTDAVGGNLPVGSLVRDSTGNLYGACYNSLFKVDSAGQETVLFIFTSEVGGEGPNGGLLRDKDGTIYGTASYGGVGNEGVSRTISRSTGATATKGAW